MPKKPTTKMPTDYEAWILENSVGGDILVRDTEWTKSGQCYWVRECSPVEYRAVERMLSFGWLRTRRCAVGQRFVRTKDGRAALARYESKHGSADDA